MSTSAVRSTVLGQGPSRPDRRGTTVPHPERRPHDGSVVASTTPGTEGLLAAPRSTARAAELARRFEAIVVAFDVVGAALDRAGAREVRALVESLCGAGMYLGLCGDGDFGPLDGRLQARPRGPGTLMSCGGIGPVAHVVGAHGPRLVQPRGSLARSASASASVLADARRRGIAPSQTVLVGLARADVPADATAIDGEAGAFLELLRDQLGRRRRGELPEAGAEPGWFLAVDGFHPEHERAHESLLTIGDGVVGTRGAPLVARPFACPGVLASGVYDGEGSDATLLSCPLWSQLAAPSLGATDDVHRMLDLRTGLLHHRVATVRAVTFSSMARPGTVVLRAELPCELDLVRDDALEPPPEGDAACETGRSDEWDRIRVAAAPVGGVVATARQSNRTVAGARHLDRVGRFVASPNAEPAPDASLDERAWRDGFEALLVEHREAWARRWEDADVVVDGDDDVQRSLRFALFHLIGSVRDFGEAAVGARGLSGPAYRGHVFWDSDVFVLPFLAATHPLAARAMLEYRVRRLADAQTLAARLGRAGARFPWESARTGFDVTPRSARDRAGRDLLVPTGDQEEHIVADVAWGAACYLDWTGDAEFAIGGGAKLLVETARYWASRVRRDRDGRAHIDHVIGPDEYHAAVDDNAFTNVMARWNLERAAAHASTHECGVADAERRRWLDIAASLVDGFDPATRLYEQFRGFFELEPLVAEDVLPRRPAAADLLLGRERVAGAQILKQADVLLLHHLVPDQLRPGTLATNLRYYEPRTAHGSSLSPAVHVPLLAEVGDWERAMRWLRAACHLDLRDLTGTTGGGVHLATMGGLWQAIAWGFAGLRPVAGGLRVAPRLPPGWRSLELRVRYRESRVELRITPERLSVRADQPIPLVMHDGGAITVGPSPVEIERRAERGETSAR